MSALKNFKIRDKLVICFSINILFMLVIGVVCYTSISKIQNNLDDIFEIRLPSVSYLLEADRDLHQALIAERTLLFTDPNSSDVSELMDAFESNKTQTYQRYQKYAELITNQDELRLVPKFKDAYRDWEKSAIEVTELAKSGSEDSRIQAITSSTGIVSDQFDFMRGFIDQATELNMKDAEKAHDQALNIYKSTIGFLFVIVLLSIGIAMFLAWFVASSITHPLSLAIEGLKEVAQGEGDLTKRLNAVGKDEIGELTKWFNAFIGNLQSIIQKVIENTNETSASANHLLEIAKKTNRDASDLAERSTVVSSSSDELSTSISAISSAVEEYSTSINVVATASEEMNSSVVEISKSTAKANEMTSQSVEEANITSEKMELLEKAALEINNVTEVINSISQQTNLLALNATIEAASAGEAGKGFAVVAHEIKELARQTSDATSEIQSQIESIQSSSQTTVGQIHKITEMIRDVDSAVTTIAAAVEEQSVTTQEISGNITQASDGIGEVAENVSNGSVATDSIAREIHDVDQLVINVNKMSEDLHVSANQLRSSSGELSDLIGKFKVA